MYTEGLQLKVKKLSREELEKLAVQAMYHLRVVSGSRNSFSSEYMEKAGAAGLFAPERTASVERMHWDAATFLQREDV
jgi:hypothetical protein